MFNINQDLCNNATLLEIFLLAKTIMGIIKVVVPILLIVMSMLDIVKVTISTDKDGKIVSKKTIDRFVAAIFVFLVVSLMDIVLSVLGVQKIGLTNCWTGATKENVAALKVIEEQQAKDAEKAEKEARERGKDKNGEINLALREELKKASSVGNSSSSSDSSDLSDGSIKQASGSCIQNNVISSKQAIVNEAMRYVGNRYVYGGNSLTNGIDCSGFTQQIMAKFGAQIPRTSGAQASAGAPVSSLAQAQAGDLIVYSEHVGIFDGKGGLVHASNSAPYPQGGIKTSPNANYRTIIAIRRVIC